MRFSIKYRTTISLMFWRKTSYQIADVVWLPLLQLWLLLSLRGRRNIVRVQNQWPRLGVHSMQRLFALTVIFPIHLINISGYLNFHPTQRQSDGVHWSTLTTTFVKSRRCFVTGPILLLSQSFIIILYSLRLLCILYSL